MRVSNTNISSVTNRSSASVHSSSSIYIIKPLVKREDGSWDLTVVKNNGQPKTT